MFRAAKSIKAKWIHSCLGMGGRGDGEMGVIANIFFLGDENVLNFWWQNLYISE